MSGLGSRTTAPGSELALYNRHLANLRATVANLDTVDEAKDLADKAAAAQTWARRVRLGQDALNHAAEVKLRAERRAGELLPGTIRPGNPSGREGLKLADMGLTERQSHEMQSLASIPEPEFDRAIEESKAEGEVTRAGVMRRSMDVHYSSDTPEWSTPQDLFDELHAEFGFTLDVCATPENAKCREFFTEENDGLAHVWRGVCWMNPPYGSGIGQWVQKAFEAGAKNGTTVVCLVPARVDTGWWWDYCRYGEIRFLRGRLRFGGGDTGAPFPSALVIFRGAQPSVEWWERKREAAAA